MDDEMRTFYYLWKYANLSPSEVYRLKHTNYGEYKMLRAFLIKLIEDKNEERKSMFCPFMIAERG